jgi:hypothetical protein
MTEAPPTGGEHVMNDDAGGRRSPLRRPPGAARAGLMAAVAGTALLAAACGGGAPATAPRAGTGGMTAQRVDAFARCVRDHGVAGFYVSRTIGHRYNGPGLNLSGWHSTPITPGSAVLSSALKACNPVLGVPGPQTATSAQLRAMVKAAACLRAHGYPDYPDPSEQNGQVVEPPPPAGVDTSSPQFESAMKACNASP